MKLSKHPRFYALILLAGMMISALPSHAETKPTKPNILFIYLDDFGWKDTGYMGSDFYETPNLDRLAKGGMVFTDAYSNSANCAPARACHLSGQYTPRHQVFNVGTKPRGSAKHRRLIIPTSKSALKEEVVTWAEALQEQGYKTGMFGKWHVGDDPTTQGFDVAVLHNKLPGFKGHYGPKGEYLADVLTNRTVKFIEENKDEPWCAYLAHFGVHTPPHPKKELLPKYNAKKPGELHNHVIMATMIQAIDDGVGKIITALDRLGERENTLIIFSSDNGGYGPATDMDPLWGYKGTYFEGGIRVPLFVNWPKVVKPGTRSSEPVIGVDFYPTFCDIAGSTLPKQAIDGKSLLPLLRGETKTFGARPIYWHFPAYLQSYEVYGEQRDPLFRARPVSVIREGDYKLKEYFEDEKIALYDLKNDIRERKNLAETMPEKRDALYKKIREWQKEVNAPRPAESNRQFDAEDEKRRLKKPRRKH